MFSLVSKNFPKNQVATRRRCCVCKQRGHYVWWLLQFPRQRNRKDDGAPAVTPVESAFNSWDGRPAGLVYVCALPPRFPLETGVRNEKWNDNGAWSTDAERASAPLSSWQRPTNVDVLQEHDPWRSQHWQDVCDDSPLPHTLGTARLAPSTPCYRRRTNSRDRLQVCATVAQALRQHQAPYTSGTDVSQVETRRGRYTGCFAGLDLFQRMIRTSGLEPRVKKFWAFGKGSSADNVGKSQRMCKNNASGTMAVFGPFWGPWMAISCQTRIPCFYNLSNILFFFNLFHHVYSQLY